LSPVQAAVLQALDWHIHANPVDATLANSELTDVVNLKLAYDRELFRASPHQVGHTLTSFGLTERKRTNTGWILLLSRDTLERIHTLLRRFPAELDVSVNRDGCSLCTDSKNPLCGANEPCAEPQKSPSSDEPKDAGGELGELRALKKG